MTSTSAVLPDIIRIVPEGSHLVGNCVFSHLEQFHQSLHVLNASILEQGEVNLVLARVVHNLGLKELGQVEDDAEEDDGDDVDGDTPGDTPCLCVISVCVGMAH